MFLPNGNGGMMYIPDPQSSKPEPVPECPHCKEKLPGWSEPSDFSFSDFLGILFVLVVVAQLFAALIGGMNGGFDRCDPAFSKRYHYILPAYPVSCEVVNWLSK